MTQQTAKTRARRKAVIFCTFLTSVTSLALLVVSMATSQWIAGSASAAGGGDLRYSMDVNWGLFGGSMESGAATDKSSYGLTVVCDSGEGVCMMGCDSSGTKGRELILQALINIEDVELDGSCRLAPNQTVSKSHLEELDGDGAHAERGATKSGREFISFGMRVATAFFWAVAAFFATLCIGGSLLNTLMAPSITLLSTFGLYITNPCAAFAGLLALILWGAHYNEVLYANLMVPQTLAGAYPDNDVSLGYSYWLMLPSVLLHIANIFLVYLSDRPERLAVRETNIQDTNKQVGSMLF